MQHLKNVLIVDDDPHLVDALAERCRQIGLFPRGAYNIMMALEQIRRRLPDLICVDVMMPGGSGLDLCELLASSPAGRRIPVIVLTGCKDSETVRRCGELCAYYIEKSGDIWSRIEPVIYELVDIEPLTSKDVLD